MSPKAVTGSSSVSYNLKKEDSELTATNPSPLESNQVLNRLISPEVAVSSSSLSNAKEDSEFTKTNLSQLEPN